MLFNIVSFRTKYYVIAKHHNDINKPAIKRRVLILFPKNGENLMDF